MREFTQTSTCSFLHPQLSMVRFKVSQLSSQLLSTMTGLMKTPPACLWQNRWFLVEFLFPSSQPVPAHTLALNPTADPLNTSAPESSYIPPPPSRKKRKKGHRPSSSAAGPSSRSPSASSDDDDSAEDSDEDPNDAEIHWPSLGPLPLLLPPPPNAVTGKPKKLDERAIYQALRTSVVQVFGDDGWGRVGGGTSGKSQIVRLKILSLASWLWLARVGRAAI